MGAFKIRTISAFLGLLGGLMAVGVHAQVKAPTVQAGIPMAPATALHPWQAALPRLTADAYFTNLKNGDKIEMPFVVRFGLSGGWGLAPISKALGGKTGHHHLW